MSVRGKKIALQICNKPYCSTCQRYITAPTPTVNATAATSPTTTAATTPTAATTITATTAKTTPTANATTTPAATASTITVLLLRNGTFKI